MKFNRTVLSTAMTLTTILVSGTSFAGSFALTTQSVSSRSMATAGAAVKTDDATVAYTNPAAMSKIKAPSVSVGASYVTTSTKISNASSNAIPVGTNDGDMGPSTMIPSAYYVTPLDLEYLKDYSAGIGVYSPFAFHANYEDTFQGRLFGDHSKLKVKTVAPSIAHAITPNLSIGASVTLNQMEGYLSAATSPTGGAFSVKGDDTAPGFTLGTLFSPVDKLEIGLVYRSEVKYLLDAKDGNVKASTSTGLNISTSGRLRITTPESYELALKFKPSDKANIYASYLRTNWSSIQELKVETAFNTAGIAAQLATQLPVGTPAANVNGTAAVLARNFSNPPAELVKYEDSDTYSLGADFAISPNLTMRGGVAVDRTPTTDAYRSVRLPTTDRMLYALGVNYKVTPSTSVDAGYSYVQEDTAKINQTKTSGGLAGSNYEADFDSNASIFMLQLNHKF